jgi:hypothetical protein
MVAMTRHGQERDMRCLYLKLGLYRDVCGNDNTYTEDWCQMNYVCDFDLFDDSATLCCRLRLVYSTSLFSAGTMMIGIGTRTDFKIGKNIPPCYRLYVVSF